MQENSNGRIHLRKPISGMRVAYYGPDPLRVEEVARMGQEAYEQGRRDAEEVCQRQITEARMEMSQLQDEVLGSIQNRYAEFTEEFNHQLPDLVLSIVGKIWEGLELDRPALLRAIDGALDQVGSNSERLVMRLCPKDAALLQGTEAFMTRYPDLKVETDPELGSGDVVLRSRFGLIDSRIGTKIRRVESEIKKAHQ
jgi:flagellar biosynthesis/type III secretory pathway protein FliH